MWAGLWPDHINLLSTHGGELQPAPAAAGFKG
jgi:hypothetical protein